MHRTSTVVVGAGQCGLAASRCLTERGVDHVVLERGEVAAHGQPAVAGPDDHDRDVRHA